jgi:hypothetical protein
MNGEQIIPFGVRPEPIGSIRCQCCSTLLIAGVNGRGPVIWKHCAIEIACPNCRTKHAIVSSEHAVRIAYTATARGIRMAESQHRHDTSPGMDGRGAVG